MEKVFAMILAHEREKPLIKPAEIKATKKEAAPHLEVGQAARLSSQGLCIFIGFCSLNGFIGGKLKKWQAIWEWER